MPNSREHWIAAALVAFQRAGVDAVNVESLARAMNVTKGSFYWHFESRDDLLHELLRLWELETTELIAAAEAEDEPLQRVLRFFDLVARGRGQLPDTEFFAWAKRDRKVATLANRIEPMRVAFIERELRCAGTPAKAAGLRAEAGYLATLGWIERSSRHADTARDFQAFAEQLFRWLFEGVASANAVRRAAASISKASALLLLSVLGACAPVQMAIKAEAPASERLLRGWVTAYNTADTARIADYLAASFAESALQQRNAQARAHSDAWLHRNLGSFDQLRIATTTDTTAEAFVHQTLVDAWGRVSVRTAAGAATRILSRSVSFFERPPPGAASQSLGNDNALIKDIDAFATKLVSADVFSGVVLLARAGDSVPLFQKAYGLADREAARRITPITRFQLGSVSKVFTALAIAALVEEGRLSFEATVSSVLDDYPSTNGRQITIAQLLTHTSGLPEYFFSPRYASVRDQLKSPREYWQLFAEDSLRFAPGSQWEYSNSNYIVLGSIIEKVTGRSFRDYIAERIWSRADMHDASYQEDGPSVATGYTRFLPGRVTDLEGYHRAERRPGSIAGPAGGGVATAADLLRLSNALLGHRLLTAAMTARVLEPRVDADDGRRTYGFEWHEINGVRFVGHNGFFDGAFNQLDIYPEMGYVVVILSNADMSGAGAIAHRLRMALTSFATVPR